MAYYSNVQGVKENGEYISLMHVYSQLLFSLKRAVTKGPSDQSTTGWVALTELHGFSSLIKSDTLTMGALGSLEGREILILIYHLSGLPKENPQVYVPHLFRDILHTISASRVSRTIFQNIMQPTVSNLWLHIRITRELVKYTDDVQDPSLTN